MTEEVKKRGRKPKPQYEIVCDNPKHLKDIGFDMAWLGKLHDEYGFDRFEYLHKFRAFRCYKGEQHIDWIDINDAAVLNGHRRLETIMLKHQPVGPKRAVIQYPWR